MADQSNRKDFELRLIEKAWKDGVFREALLMDPQGTVESALRGELPAGTKVKVVEETANTIYLVLPAKPDRVPAGQLTEEQFDAVAGGDSDATWCSDCEQNTVCPACSVAATGEKGSP
jgi:hypothetical protein